MVLFLREKANSSQLRTTPPMHNTFIVSRICIGLLVLMAAAAHAQVVRGPNGHFYQVVIAQGTTWSDANAGALSNLRCGQAGHLATITSEEEDLFLESIRVAAVTAAGVADEVYVGGFQANDQVGPTLGWQWVNGEGPISGVNGGSTFANWYPDGVLCCGAEPNDCCGSPGFENNEENFLGIGLFGLYGWNDEGATGNVGGYIVEWDVDATVIIDGCDSNVPNVIVDPTTHCTISDLIADCAASAASHGRFVSCVAEVTNMLRKSELISGAEKGRIQSCAGRAAIP